MRKPLFAVALLLAATVLFAFSPVLDAGFLSLDDGLYVTGNARVLAGLSPEGARWAFAEIEAGYWHPLTWLSYMADVTIAGPSPRWFHLVNLSLHAVNAVLLLAVLARLTGAFWPSALVASLFALHPLHVESVAWIAERKDVLYALFWFLTVGAYHGYARRPTLRRYLLVLLLYALGLMTKPMLVTLPFALLLLDFWPLGRSRFGPGRPAAGLHPPVSSARLVLEKVPLLALAAAASGLALVAQQRAGAVGSLAAFPLASRLANAALTYLAYVRDTVWPRRLAVIYPHLQQGSVGWPAVLSGLLLLGACVAVLVAARRRPALLVGWAWFLGTLVPVIGLVQVGLQSRADRFTYVPQIGLGLMLAWGVAAGGTAWRRRRAHAATAAALGLLVLAGMTRAQAGHWRDDDTLLLHAIQVTEGNWLAHRYLALSLDRRGRPEEAMTHLREIQRLKPAYLDSHAAFGFALSGARREVDEAAAAAVAAANAQARDGRLEEAERGYREALRLQPRHGLALHNLAGVLTLQGRPREAIPLYRQAAETLPRNADVQANLGRALFEAGDGEEARAAYHRAARLEPRFAEEMAQRGDALRARGDVPAARRWYREALDLNPGDAAVRARLEALP